MGQYLVLIYEDETGWEDANPEEFGRMMAEHQRFGERHQASIRGGNALMPTATATSVRRELGGEPVVTDGPFIETKEALGGFYLVEAEDLDEALAIAREVPAPFGGVEVRPVRVFD